MLLTKQSNWQMFELCTIQSIFMGRRESFVMPAKCSMSTGNDLMSCPYPASAISAKWSHCSIIIWDIQVPYYQSCLRSGTKSHLVTATVCLKGNSIQLGKRREKLINSHKTKTDRERSKRHKIHSQRTRTWRQSKRDKNRLKERPAQNNKGWKDGGNHKRRQEVT